MTSPLSPPSLPAHFPKPAESVIQIRGARTHNLQAIDVEIPLGQLVVFTGISGSGKSSLVYDTIFRAGQRRFLEHLSPGSRRLIERWERPDVDRIDGLPPTVGVAQRSALPRLRSTLGTLTEIYDALRVLYARAGTAHCTQCGKPVSRQSVSEIVARILAFPAGAKLMILAPLVRARKGAHDEVMKEIRKAGFVRVRIDGTLHDTSETPKLAKTKPHTIEAVIDRIIVKEGLENRLRESVETALRHGQGVCLISCQQGEAWKETLFSEKFSCPDCELDFAELEPRTFSFNSPHGACAACHGLGVRTIETEGPAGAAPTTTSEVSVRGRGPGLGQPSRSKTVRSETLPVENLESAARESMTPCAECGGTRLAPFGRGVTLTGVTLPELCRREIAAVADMFDELRARVASDTGLEGESFSPVRQQIVSRLLPEVLAGLRFLQRVGLGYLTLERPTPTLSGGELQRAHLAAYLGSEMTDVAYILDEPTGGLHARDAARLVELARQLVAKGNSVLCIEHDESFMRGADLLIDVGPGAGHRGGRIVAAGSPEEVASQPESATGNYLSGRGLPGQMAAARDFAPSADRPALRLRGATLHNLRSVDLEIPLQALVAVSGVSGCGKSSLILETLVPAVRRQFQDGALTGGPFTTLEGVDQLRGVVEVDQQPLGRSGRSNPATYSGAWDEIRELFSRTRDARARGFSSRRFSFNSPGGRCSACHGTGTETIRGLLVGKQQTVCSVCRGARFNRQTLSVKYQGKNVADVLSLEIEQAVEFFRNHPRLHRQLASLADLGLGYLQLGQSALSLSGGESQRVKLAAALGRRDDAGLLYVLDEPTTGLHPTDIQRLLVLLRRLVDGGRTVIVVEHQLDVLAESDWLIDLGPEGGSGGGEIIAVGTPRDVAAGKSARSLGGKAAVRGPTAEALAEYFARRGGSSPL